MKRRVFSIIFLMLLSIYIGSATIKAASPEDFNFNASVNLFWTDQEAISKDGEFHLVTDEFDGMPYSIPMIADFSLTAIVDEIVAYNGVNAVYFEHSESYIYWVFDGINEVVDFYNYKFHKKETVAYADLIDVVRYDNPEFTDYNNGYNEARDEYGVFINGEWMRAVDYGELQYNDGYDLGVEAGYFLDKQELYKEVFNIDYLPKITYGKPGLEEEAFYLLPRKNYYVSGSSKYININDDSYYFDENFNIKKDRISISSSNLAVLETYIEFYVKNRLMPAGKYEVFIDSDGTSLQTFTYLNIRSLDDTTIYSRELISEYQKYVRTDNYTVNLSFEDINYNSISYKYEDENYHHQLLLDGKKTIPPIPPTKDGYIFVGWFEEDSDEAYTFNEVLENDIVLYAGWIKEKFNIDFYLGEELYHNMLYDIETAFILPSTPISENEDYVFLGWYYDEEFTEQFKVTDPIEDDVTLYGKFGLGGSGGTETPPEETPGTEFKLEKKYVIIAAIVFIGIGLALIIRKRK